jgi:predicted HicB family RNase H-like nuclease
MKKPGEKAQVKSSDERRARIEQEGLAAHKARVKHDTHTLARARKVQLNLRVWPEERNALVEEARAQGYTLNGWATGLMLNAREQRMLLNARQVLDDAVRKFEPLVEEAHALSVSGDYRRAVGKLLLLLRPLMDQLPGREREAIDDVTREIEGCDRVLEAEAAMRVRSLRTGEQATGGAL